MRYDRLSGFFFVVVILAGSFWCSPRLFGQISTDSASGPTVEVKKAPALSEQEQKEILGFSGDTSSSRAVDFPVAQSVANGTTIPDKPASASGYTPVTGTPLLDSAAARENGQIGKRKIGQTVGSGNSTSGEPGAGNGAASGTSIWRSLFSLVVVLTIIIVLAWLARKFAPNRVSVSLGRTVQVVGRSAIGARHNLTLVRFGNELLLLAVSGDNVRLIDKVTDPDKIATLMGSIESERVSSISRSFAGVLSKSREDYQLDDNLEDEVVIEEFQEEGSTIASAAERELGGLLAKVKSLSKIKNKREK